MGFEWILRTSMRACSLGRGISIFRSNLEKLLIVKQTMGYFSYGTARPSTRNTFQVSEEQGPRCQVCWLPWSFSPGDFFLVLLRRHYLSHCLLFPCASVGRTWHKPFQGHQSRPFGWEVPSVSSAIWVRNNNKLRQLNRHDLAKILGLCLTFSKGTWISLSALVPSLNLLPPMASISSMKMMQGWWSLA